MNNVKINPIYLGNYINWNYQKQVEIIRKELDWQGDELEGVPQEANKSFSKIECFMQGSRDYIKYLKRGYTRISQNMSDELRKGNISTDEAKKMIELEGQKPESLKILLEYLNISEEFNKKVSSMIVHPNKPNFKTNKIAKKTKDFEKWYREK